MMRGLFILWLMVASCCSARAEVIPVDVLVVVESGNDGDAISTSYLNSVTRGSGVNSWTTAVATPVGTEVETSTFYNLISPVWIRSGIYETGEGDTRCFSYPIDENDESYWSLPLSTSRDNITLAYKVRFTETASDDYDLPCIMISGGNAIICHVGGAGEFTFHTGSPS
jgi:hypothetical protein